MVSKSEINTISFCSKTRTHGRPSIGRFIKWVGVICFRLEKFAALDLCTRIRRIWLSGICLSWETSDEIRSAVTNFENLNRPITITPSGAISLSCCSLFCYSRGKTWQGDMIPDSGGNHFLSPSRPYNNQPKASPAVLTLELNRTAVKESFQRYF